MSEDRKTCTDAHRQYAEDYRKAGDAEAAKGSDAKAMEYYQNADEHTAIANDREGPYSVLNQGRYEPFK